MSYSLLSTKSNKPWLNSFVLVLFATGKMPSVITVDFKLNLFLILSYFLVVCKKLFLTLLLPFFQVPFYFLIKLHSSHKSFPLIPD